MVHPIRKVLKGLRYLKNYGLRATLRKMKYQFRPREKHCNFEYPKAVLDKQRNTVFPREIKFSILVPLYNTPLPFLKEMVKSVIDQTYSNWELCLADGSDDAHAEVGQAVLKMMETEPRIRYQKLERNLGISENTNACIDMATGDFIALFDHDDLLHKAALFEMMQRICDENADFVYTDELTFLSPDLKKIVTVHYKPDYAPDNLRANNYICHFSAFSRELLEKAGKFNPAFDGSQDHDMILRLTEHANKIVHIPKVLYYWRSHPQSVAMDINSKQYAITAGKNAVKASINRMGYDVEVESSPAFPTIYRFRYAIKENKKVSIIIPNKDHVKDLKKCLQSIFDLTTYPNYEIVIVDNGSTDEKLFAYYEELKARDNVTICSLDIPFNYSKLNNFAVTKATGDYYLLLNNDIKIITPEWIEEMLMYAQRDDVGAVGAKLYYPDDTIQHAGVVLGIGPDGFAGHAFHKEPRGYVGYMGRLYYAQNVMAVTAACMLVKASVYREIGGLDEDFEIAFNDVDFCMKIRKAGYLNVWTPFAEAYHYESKTRGYEDTKEKRERFLKEGDKFRTRWKQDLEREDIYYPTKMFF